MIDFDGTEEDMKRGGAEAQPERSVDGHVDESQDQDPQINPRRASARANGPDFLVSRQRFSG